MKNIKAPSIVTIAILSVITIVFWIIFSVFRLLSTPTDIKVPEEILSPLNPTLDIGTLRSVEGKIFFSEGQIQEIPLIEIPEVIVEELEEVEVATEEAEISTESSELIESEGI